MAPVGVGLQRVSPRVGLKEEISPESFFNIVIAGNLKKAQPRSRQRHGDRLGVRREAKPCTFNVQR